MRIVAQYFKTQLDVTVNKLRLWTKANKIPLAKMASLGRKPHTYLLPVLEKIVENITMISKNVQKPKAKWFAHLIKVKY